MKFIFSNHALEQITRRKIDREMVMLALNQPQQIIENEDDSSIVIYQLLIKENEQHFLLRVFVNKNKQPNVIVTVYKTTKITKYL
jgi:hypothetical protein